MRKHIFYNWYKFHWCPFSCRYCGHDIQGIIINFIYFLFILILYSVSDRCIGYKKEFLALYSPYVIFFELVTFPFVIKSNYD